MKSIPVNKRATAKKLAQAATQAGMPEVAWMASIGLSKNFISSLRRGNSTGYMRQSSYDKLRAHGAQVVRLRKASKVKRWRKKIIPTQEPQQIPVVDLLASLFASNMQDAHKIAVVVRLLSA